ncbi:calaxin-like [Uloborus diversus]|uniref:calaxin-like n=1 Tax=Uloborus diversus TaxID=327109 RepID=UPI00240A48AF|nr:calaxin-like [Uloborus diversus]
MSETNSEASGSDPDMLLVLLELILNKMDKDSDGFLNYEEFKNAALQDWLLIEIFGQCLPDYKRHVSFLEEMKNFTDNK